MDVSQNICLICKACPNMYFEEKKFVSIYDSFDFIKIKDMLEDFNYKYPLDDPLTPKVLCFDCYVTLVHLYDFRDEFCGWFFNANNSDCSMCFQSGDFYYNLKSDSVFVNGKSHNIVDILTNICEYDLNVTPIAKICTLCYNKLISHFRFHLRCKKSVIYWTGRILHRKKKSYINKIIKSKQLVQSNVNEEIKGENMFRIITYSSYSRLSRHKTSELLLIAFKNAMRGKRRVYKKVPSEPFYNLICEKCGRFFTTNLSLNRHLMLHNGIMPFECKYCSNKYASTKSLNRHIQKTHRENEERRLFICEKCSKSFSENSRLKKHLEVTHSDKKPFPCKVCQKSFKSSYACRTHLRIHTGETPFKCNICSKQFTYNCSLKNHLKSHSKVT